MMYCFSLPKEEGIRTFLSLWAPGHTHTFSSLQYIKLVFPIPGTCWNAVSKQGSHSTLFFSSSTNCVFLHSARDKETLKHCPGSEFQDILLVCSVLYTLLRKKYPIHGRKSLCGFCNGFESLASWGGLCSFMYKRKGSSRSPFVRLFIWCAPGMLFRMGLWVYWRA